MHTSNKTFHLLIAIVLAVSIFLTGSYALVTTTGLAATPPVLTHSMPDTIV